MEYNHNEIDKKWQQIWAENGTYHAPNSSDQPKFYVLDMFPYPSGAGLHVGHPLGYIASDIYGRYKKQKGFNVLHPMGYDAFGLPAEQYAIQTGQHPEKTTAINTARYREQLDNIGFGLDWSREFKTTDPSYYKWTQWIFIQLFDAWYDHTGGKSRHIDSLIKHLNEHGTKGLQAAETEALVLTAEEWKGLNEKAQSEVLLNYRLAYRSESNVNWCPALGTVLANDEVKDGVSERGGHPVIQKKMMQWSMRITAFADRLLEGLDRIDWSNALKETQRNWIGKSVGAALFFDIQNHPGQIEVFSTRPDTLFGATFLTLAPEHEWVDAITTAERSEAVAAYKEKAASRSERDRMADTKTISGCFTGAYALHPITKAPVPIWIGDYVLASYGTGAVMAVPAHDSRDYAFAKHFDLPILEVVEGGDITKESYDAKSGKMANSGFLNGMDCMDAKGKMIEHLEEIGFGKGATQFKLRDAIFGRQRYWGEPIPVYYDKGIPKTLPLEDLPLTLPVVDAYLPTEDGEPPLARAKNWAYKGCPLETTTMPGWAGSSWYFLRYMDAHNETEFAGESTVAYWNQVDLYVGGSEHATGHLLYSRFWTKALYDLGHINFDEPFKKLINQGMIQGISAFVHRINGTNTFVSAGLKDQHETHPLHADVSFLQGDELDVEAFRNWREEYKSAEFILEEGKYICSREVEKMSKSKFNVTNPDHIVIKYGADVLRMYEMFLGPIEQSKPWNTQGLSGVAGFQRKFWKLFHMDGTFNLSEAAADKRALKAAHTCIKKVGEDIENFSFNTSVSAFMIATNELTELKANNREVLEPLVRLIAPFAPHLAEELWEKLDGSGSVTHAAFPQHNENYLIESSKNYPVSFNGKVRFQLELPLDMAKEAIEKAVLEDPRTLEQLGDKQVRKMIVVPGRIINIVIG
jgi:leucyl-tRNA synthetase